MIGVNLSGAEFGTGSRYGYDYIYPSKSDLAFYADRGVEMVRLPFKWERMQKTLGGELDPAELGRLKQFLVDADALGVKVILDLHNYGRYGGQAIGSDAVPTTAFADFWGKMAAAVGNSPALLGYDIMNEPHDMPTSWKASAQAAVDAIRMVDMEHKIYVEGTGWASARYWTNGNEDLLIRDAANLIVYQAHIYFDSNGSGTYDQGYDAAKAYANMGADRISNFVDWLDRNGVEGFIGEFAVPDNDPRWLTVLDSFLATLEELGIDGTYWGAGPWFGDYKLGLRQKNGEERAQMDILEKYLVDPGATQINGTAAADQLAGTRGIDTIRAGAGNDTVSHSLGADWIDGGDGTDTVSYATAAKGVTVSLATGVQTVDGIVEDRLVSIENITGSRHADILTGDAGANVLMGGDNDDRLVGGAGADLLDGGKGTDTVDYSGSLAAVRIDFAAAVQAGGDAEGDRLVGVEKIIGSRHDDVFAGGSGSDVVEGGAGNDVFRTNGSGTDQFFGGDDSDTIDLSSTAKGFTLSLADGGTRWLKLVSVENIIGTAFKDDLTGDGGVNRITGGAGNDRLDGRGGADILDGGTGADVYYVDDVNDVIMEAGSDVDIVYASASFTLPTDVEKLIITATQAVSVRGSAGNNELRGNDTDSALYGMAGNDSLLGGAGDEIIDGGTGGDWIIGGKGNDRFWGGTGSDTFVFAAGDIEGIEWINDFSRAENDHIDLSRIDADTGRSGDQKFAFIGSAAFTGLAGQLRATATDGGWQVAGDVDGDRVADFMLIVKASLPLVSGDFYL